MTGLAYSVHTKVPNLVYLTASRYLGATPLGASHCIDVNLSVIFHTEPIIPVISPLMVLYLKSEL